MATHRRGEPPVDAAGLRQLGDEELMRLIAGGDPRAFEVVYERHCTAAFSLAYRICGVRATAEEVAQEAFLAIWRSGGRYDRTRGSVRTWLLGVVHNRAIDMLRRTTVHERHRAADERAAESIEAAVRVQNPDAIAKHADAFARAAVPVSHHRYVLRQSVPVHRVGRIPSPAPVAVHDPQAQAVRHRAVHPDLVHIRGAVPVVHHRSVPGQAVRESLGGRRIIGELPRHIQHPGTATATGLWASEDTQFGPAIAVPVSNHGSIAWQTEGENPVSASHTVPLAIVVEVEIPHSVAEHAEPCLPVPGPVAGDGLIAG